MDDHPDNQLDGIELSEAAELLGVSSEALRKRIQRGTVQGYKVDGRWYAVLPHSDFERDNAQNDEQTAQDTSQDVVQAYIELVRSLKDENTFLKQQLLSRDEESKRKDSIISGFSQRILELPEKSQTLQEQESIKQELLNVVQKEIAATQERLEEREAELDRRLQERDRKLMETLRAIQEQKVKKRWWQR